MYFCLCTCMCVRVAVWLRRDCWLVVAIVSRVCLHNIPFLGWLAGASCYCLVSLLVNLVAIIWASDGCCEFILPSLCIWKALHWMAWHVKTIGASSKWRARPLKYGMLFILQWSQMTTHFVFFLVHRGQCHQNSLLSLSLNRAAIMAHHIAINFSLLTWHCTYDKYGPWFLTSFLMGNSCALASIIEFMVSEWSL